MKRYWSVESFKKYFYETIRWELCNSRQAINMKVSKRESLTQ